MSELSPSTQPTVDPKILARAIHSARTVAAKIVGQVTKGEITTYKQIEDLYGIELTGFANEEAKQKAIGPAFYARQVLERYVAETESRLLAANLAATAQGPKKRLRLTPQAECYRFTRNKNHALYPEQDPVFRSLVDDMFVNPQRRYRTAWNNGRTGSGKTEIINAIVDWFTEKGLHNNPAIPVPLPAPILWFTVTNAVEQSKTKARKAGLGWAIDKFILHILPYSALYSSEGEGFLWRKVITPDPFTGEDIETYEWCPMAFPQLVIFDEAQKIKKEGTTTAQRIRLLDEFVRSVPIATTQFLFFTATLAEKINDTKMFVCMSDVKYEGQLITYDNFNVQFAQIIGEGRPDLPNKAAMDRFRKFFQHRLYEIPKTRWPFAAKINLRFFKFLTPEDKNQYDTAIEEYLDQIAKLGKKMPNEMALRAIALLKLRKKVEPIRSRQVADCMHEDVLRGESAIMGTAFTASIIKSIFHLIDKYGVSRDQISVIWGGRDNVKPERLISQEELLEIAGEALKSGEGIPKKVFRLIKMNLAWQEDRMLFGDASEQAQNERYQLLKDLKLIGVQTIQQRQYEIDKFMSGQSKYCFFTTASGGTGLSLEHADARQSPRNLYASPIYSGMEFVQVMGRPHRRNSISDTKMWICLMADTVEQNHVAPILSNKLESLGAGSTAKDDLTTILSRLDPDEFRTVNNKTDYQTIETDELDGDDDEDNDDE